MSIKKLLFVCTIPYLIVGCAEISGTQPPAPVYGGQPSTYQKPAPTVQQKPYVDNSQSASEVKIQTLKDITTPETVPLESTPVIIPETSAPTSPSSGDIAPMEVAPTEKIDNLPDITEAKPFEPLDSVASGSAAVSALVLSANQDSQAGKMDSAVATMERAIRLEPRNPTLLYKLAVLRLQQSKPAQAEDLAKKAALLASKDAKLKKHSWLLIARAREMQQDNTGAQEARRKADSF